MTSGSAPLRAGTRGSRLALRQVQLLKDAFAAAGEPLTIEPLVIETLGDREPALPLARLGEKGAFTEELDAALRAKRIDVAVHSLKDLPTQDGEGLVVAALLAREDPREALVSRGRLRLAELPSDARIGTCSLRRRAQLLALHAGLRIVEMRGNVPTRVEKVERGDCDAAVLARAGLVRLGLEDRIAEVFAPANLLPAPGQGAIAIACRTDDARTRQRLAALDHRPTRLATAAERAFLQRLDGGCRTPIAALATLAGARLRLDGLVASLDGAEIVRGDEVDDAPDETAARAIGERLAARLVERGAARIVAAARAAAGMP